MPRILSCVVCGVTLIFSGLLLLFPLHTAEIATASSANENASAQATKPVIEGPEGKRAFDDLAVYYRGNNRMPPIDNKIWELQSTKAATRAAVGKYLLALLAQSLADETNGRGNWQRSIAWGGGADSDARSFRSFLAKKLAGQTTAAEALDAAEWLLDRDDVAENQTHGVTLLCRINSPQVENVFRRLLAKPHPNQSVIVAVLEQVAERKLKGLAPQVRRLAVHYRTAVRAAASKTAAVLEIGDLPEYRPEEAFSPWLDNRLKDFIKMVEGDVPEGAKWCIFTVTYPPYREGAKPGVWTGEGWLLSEDDNQIQVLTRFGGRLTLKKEQTKVEPSTLAEAAGSMLEIREKDRDEKSNKNAAALSRQGTFTAQFEPHYISLPEALVAAWLYQRGEKKLTAELLFPRIEATEDDRWIGRSVRNLIGTVYHKQMLVTFSNDRDYARAIQLAKHLSQPVFDDFPYQERAKRLAEQLAKRSDDFKERRLPTPDQWTELKKTLDRGKQIEYLAERLRLLNCFQWGQPGGVNYSDPQTAEPGINLASELKYQRFLHLNDPQAAKPQQVINPYVELHEMNIQVAELPVLVPFLADENYMPTYSFWRDFHPARTLHQVNWAVADIVDDAAKCDLAQLQEFDRLDEQGRRKHLDAILEWCRCNADKTEKQLLLQSLAEEKDWYPFKRAANEAAEKGLTEALPILVRRFRDFDRCQDDISEFCYRLDCADAVAPARKWLTSDNKYVRFWSALILLQHGDRARLEGLADLEALLAEDDRFYRYKCAIGPLTATKNERAMVLACGILKKEHFTPTFSGMILQQLFLAGREECLEYLLTKLNSEKEAGEARGKYAGKEIRRPQVEGDRVAYVVSSWQSGEANYYILAPDDQRRAERKRLKGWLMEQFTQIKAGKEPDMKKISEKISPERCFFDAP